MKLKEVIRKFDKLSQSRQAIYIERILFLLSPTTQLAFSTFVQNYDFNNLVNGNKIDTKKLIKDYKKAVLFLIEKDLSEEGIGIRKKYNLEPLDMNAELGEGVKDEARKDAV